MREAVNGVLLAVYAGTVLYFLRRFLQRRRWASLGVAMLPLGWVVVAIEGTLHMRAAMEVKLVGAALGLLLLWLVLSADRGKER